MLKGETLPGAFVYSVSIDESTVVEGRVTQKPEKYTGLYPLFSRPVVWEEG